jgi:hypothetical protein
LFLLFFVYFLTFFAKGMGATPGAPQFSQTHRQRRLTPKKGALQKFKIDAKAGFNNSTNSLFINEAPTAPDEKELTRCVSKALAVLLDQRTTGGEDSIFDETVFPLKKDQSFAVPSVEELYQFLRAIYKRTRMQPECLVMTVSYLEKLIASQAMVLSTKTWR